jgi:hypothetical protein
MVCLVPAKTRKAVFKTTQTLNTIIVQCLRYQNDFYVEVYGDVNMISS